MSRDIPISLLGNLNTPKPATKYSPNHRNGIWSLPPWRRKSRFATIHVNIENICPLVSQFPTFPEKQTSGRTVDRGGEGISDLSGCQVQGRCFDPESGIQFRAVSFPAWVEKGVRCTAGRPTGEEIPLYTGGSITQRDRHHPEGIVVSVQSGCVTALRLWSSAVRVSATPGA